MDKRNLEQRLERLEYASGGYAIGVQRLDKGHHLVRVMGTNEKIEEERFRARYPHGMLIRVQRKPMNLENRYGNTD